MTNKEALELFYSMKHNRDKYYKLDDDSLFDFLLALDEEEHIHFFKFVNFFDSSFIDRLDYILKSKIKSLNDIEKFNFLINPKIASLIKRIIMFMGSFGSLYYDLFQDKNYFYRFLMFFYNNHCIDESCFMLFKAQDFDYFSCYIDEVFKCHVDLLLIKDLLVNDNVSFKNFYYLIKRDLGDLFNETNSKILGKDFLLAIINNLYDLPRLLSCDYIKIKKIYDCLANTRLFEYQKFSLAIKIYQRDRELVSTIIDRDELMLHIDTLLTMHHVCETVDYEDLGVYKKLFLSQVKKENSLVKLKKIISNYLFLTDDFSSCYDYKMLLKIKEEEYLKYQRVIRIFKMLYLEKDIERLKLLALTIATSKNILLEMTRFIDDVPSIYMHETNKRLLKVKVPVYVLDGKCFNMMVHVLNGCGLGGDYLNLNNNYGSRDICMSLITDINMGLINTDNIVLGFDNILEKNLLGMCYRDYYSDYDGYNFFFDQLYFSDPRTNSLMTCYYNEYTFKRDDSLRVSYVVCFDKIKDEEQKAAHDLGVPIVLVKRVCYLQRNQKIIEELERNIIQGHYYLIPSYLLLNVQYCSLKEKSKKEYLRSVQRRIDRLLLIIRDVDFKEKKTIVTFCNEALKEFDDRKWQHQIYRLGILK